MTILPLVRVFGHHEVTSGEQVSRFGPPPLLIHSDEILYCESCSLAPTHNLIDGRHRLNWIRRTSLFLGLVLTTLMASPAHAERFHVSAQLDASGAMPATTSTWTGEITAILDHSELRFTEFHAVFQGLPPTFVLAPGPNSSGLPGNLVANRLGTAAIGGHYIFPYLFASSLGAIMSGTEHGYYFESAHGALYFEMSNMDLQFGGWPGLDPEPFDNWINAFSVFFPQNTRFALYDWANAADEVIGGDATYVAIESVHTVSPSSMALSPGGTSPILTGRVYLENVTEAPGQGAGITLEVGFGPDGTEPWTDPGWQWFPASYAGDAGDFDEYTGMITAGIAGDFDYGFRYSDGSDWIYGDLNASTFWYSPDEAGSLVVGATAAPEVPGPGTHLHAARPNPFNPRTELSFELFDSGPVTLEVFDLTGRRVRTLVQEFRGAGTHEVVWRGLDESGRRVASGVYLYKLRAGSFVETRRMVLLK